MKNENSQLFITVDRLVVGYKRSFLIAVALNVLLSVTVVYLGLRAKDRDVVYVSDVGVERTISEQLQTKLHSEWLIRQLFEVDGYSIHRKHEHALALGDVRGVLANFDKANITTDIVRRRQAFSVALDSLTITNNMFPYRVRGTFQRIDSQTLARVRFSYTATMVRAAVSAQNPLGLRAQDVVINSIQ